MTYGVHTASLRPSMRRCATGIAACAAAPTAWGAGGLLAPSSDLSRMVFGATPTVQLVMGVLLLASILSWATLFVKLRELSQARRTLRHAADRLKLAASRSEISEPARSNPAVRQMLDEAQDEWSRSEPLLMRGGQGDGVQQRIAARVQGVESEFGDRMAAGLGILATVSSVTPFIGLFGTVWGIMHSFLGIAESNTTSLAVVAPGIAEALLATGLGLAAAIPATLMYNALTRRVSIYRAELAASSTTLMCLVSRDVDLVVGIGAGYRQVPPPVAGKTALASVALAN